MGKGSRRRPSRISQAEFDRRWRLAFGPENSAEDRLTRDTIKIGEHPIRVLGVSDVPANHVVMVTDDALREAEESLRPGMFDPCLGKSVLKHKRKGKHDRTRTPARSGNVRGGDKVRSRAVGSPHGS